VNVTNKRTDGHAITILCVNGSNGNRYQIHLLTLAEALGEADGEAFTIYYDNICTIFIYKFCYLQYCAVWFNFRWGPRDPRPHWVL